MTDSGKGESEHESFSSNHVQVATMPSQTHHTIQVAVKTLFFLMFFILRKVKKYFNRVESQSFISRNLDPIVCRSAQFMGIQTPVG